MSLRYVTTNEGKIEEALEYLDSGVAQFDYDYTEIQAGDLETVAAHGAREAFRAANADVGGDPEPDPVIVDDAGLFIDGFDGFPGPYSSYVEDTLGVKRVGAIARNADVTRASFRCVLAYCDGESFEATPEPVDLDGRRGQDVRAADRDAATTDDTVAVAVGELPVKLFVGNVPGRIVEPRGDGGFGYDPIFEHDGRTLAEMSPAEKNAISHRGRALAKFADWYVDR